MNPNRLRPYTAIAMPIALSLLLQACGRADSVAVPIILGPQDLTQTASAGELDALSTKIAGYGATQTAIEENMRNPVLTPLPETGERENISMCLDAKVIEACASPITAAEASKNITEITVMASLNKNNMPVQIY